MKRFEYSRFGFSFIVYENRIETIEGAFKSLSKKETIFLKNISSVDVKGLTRKLSIALNDGKTKEYIIGTTVEDAKNAISELL